jgi:hypothetical protein
MVEPTGVWSSQEEARLSRRLPAGASTEVELARHAEPCVTAEQPELELELWVRGDRLAHAVRHGKRCHPLRIRSSRVVLGPEREPELDLRADDPPLSVALRVPSDPRLFAVYPRLLLLSRRR